MSFFFLMIRRPPRSTPFPTRRSSDLVGYQGRQIDLAKAFSRLGLPDAIRKQGIQGDLRERKFLSKKLTELGVEHGSGQGWGALQLMLFEAVAEKHLVDPTFIDRKSTRLNSS